MGVRRAVELAIAETDKKNIKQVFTLGPLVHNPAVLCALEKRGVKVLNEPPFILPAGSSIIIRAHGIAPEIELSLHGKNRHIVDATCPKVKASQLKAKELSLAGYSLFLAGEAHHAEIESILGYANPAPVFTIADADEARVAAAELCNQNSGAKTALLGQTTISEEEYKNIGGEIKKYFPNLEIVQSICNATKDRQQALRRLLDQVDAVIVAGGRESANTRRLFAIAQESGKPCVLVEDAAGLPEEFFSCKNIGITAGASTPDSVIAEIEKVLQENLKN